MHLLDGLAAILCMFSFLPVPLALPGLLIFITVVVLLPVILVIGIGFLGIMLVLLEIPYLDGVIG